MLDRWAGLDAWFGNEDFDWIAAEREIACGKLFRGDEAGCGASKRG